MVRQARCSHILVDSYEQALDLQRRVYAFEDAAFSYNPGDMTIVQTQFGWHLIYVYGQR